MSSQLYRPPGPQLIAEVLDATFRIFQASFLKCLPHGVISMIVGQLPGIYSLIIGRSPHQSVDRDPLWWTFYVIGTILGLFIWSAMLLRQRAIASAEPTDARAELLSALRLMPQVIALFVIVLLLLAVGVVALIIPALYLAVALSLAWLVLLIEGPNPVGAVRRSLHLVRGNWWRTAIVFAIATVAAIVCYVMAFIVLGTVLRIAGMEDIAMFTAVSVVVLVALVAVAAPFYGAVLFAVYGDLRVRREGVDLAVRLEPAPLA